MPVVRLIGAGELLGAMGLTLPVATKIAPILTPLIATGLGVVMVGAIITRDQRKDGGQAFVFALVLLAGCLFIAWGRFGPYAL